MNESVSAPLDSDPIVIEVCVASLADALISQAAGAHRIELNQALELDGLTPSVGLTQRVLSEVQIPVIAMARPCSGGFCYGHDEWMTLLADASWMLENGVDGVAFGALDADQQIDEPKCRQLRRLAGNKQLVFHKAFDAVFDAEAALERLIDCGIDRVMTSGLAPTALEGRALIGRLQHRAQGRIEILPAGKISSQNVVRIVAETSCTQIHGSFGNSDLRDLTQEILRVREQLNDADVPRKT